MKFVVHLSSVLSVDITAGLAAFVEIEKASFPYRPNPSCFTLNNSLGAKMRVMAKYNASLMQQQIKEYRLGKIGTLDFLEGLLKNFPGLEEAIEERLSNEEGDVSALLATDFLSKKIADIRSVPESYLFKSGLCTVQDKHSIALALLEEAFNEILTFSPKNKADLTALLTEAKKQDAEIVLFSNTNPLNLHRAFELMQSTLNDAQRVLDPPKNLENNEQQLLIALCPRGRDISIVSSHIFNTLSLTEPMINLGVVGNGDIYISPYKQDLQKVKGNPGVGSSVKVFSSIDACFDTNTAPRSRWRCC